MLVNYTDDLRPGARRFDGGEFPQFVLTPMAEAALTQILQWSVDRVAATISRLTGMIADEAESMACRVLSKSKRAGHILGLRLDGGVTETLRERLAAKRVFVGVRGDCIRVAPHVHNLEEDVERFLSALRAGLKQG